MGGKSFQLNRVRQLERQWERLATHYLPITFAGSKWRYSRSLSEDGPEQGWKLHISATVLSASDTLAKVGPFLCRHGVLFKAPISLQELSCINSGLEYGFSQVGKFITVYPRDSNEAVFLASKLDRLTRNSSGPAVPYDRRYRVNSSLYYRYGGFQPLTVKRSDGSEAFALKDQEGRLIEDSRSPSTAVPKWLKDPFVGPIVAKGGTSVTSSPLKSTILAYEAISQRGKGGVYLALDVSVKPIRQCVLKEGRKNGETDWAGRDGYWRVKHEAKVLADLFAKSVSVPRIYSRFEVEEHYYLVMELVEGQSLQSLLYNRKMKVSEAIAYGAQLAKMLHSIHRAGWVWRDCKPTNIVVTASRGLVLLDFEGACQVTRPDVVPWGTPGYAPKKSLQALEEGGAISDDLYALGSVLHQLLTGNVPRPDRGRAVMSKLGPHIPAAVKKVVTDLLQFESHLQPNALRVSELLETFEETAGSVNS